MATTNTSGTNSSLKPSCAIVKFWQGIVEIVLRVIVLVRTKMILNINSSLHCILYKTSLQILSFGLMVSTAIVISRSPVCFTCHNIATIYWLLVASVATVLGEAFGILARFVNLNFLARHGKAKSSTVTKTEPELVQ